MTMLVSDKEGPKDGNKRPPETPPHKGHKPERTEPTRHEGHGCPDAHPEGHPNGHPEHHRPTKPTSD